MCSVLESVARLPTFGVIYKKNPSFQFPFCGNYEKHRNKSAEIETNSHQLAFACQ